MYFSKFESLLLNIQKITQTNHGKKQFSNHHHQWPPKSVSIWSPTSKVSSACSTSSCHIFLSMDMLGSDLKLCYPKSLQRWNTNLSASLIRVIQLYCYTFLFEKGSSFHDLELLGPLMASDQTIKQKASCSHVSNKKESRTNKYTNAFSSLTKWFCSLY